MVAMASQITSLTIVYSTVHSGADLRRHQSSASLAFVRGIHRWPVNSPHKGPVTRKIFPFDDVIMHTPKCVRFALCCVLLWFTDQAPVPLTIFRSNWKFDQNLQCSGLKRTWSIRTKFCTRHGSVTLVMCAKFRCDRLSIFWFRTLHFFFEFRIRSKYL